MPNSCQNCEHKFKRWFPEGTHDNPEPTGYLVCWSPDKSKDTLRNYGKVLPYDTDFVCDDWEAEKDHSDDPNFCGDCASFHNGICLIASDGDSSRKKTEVACHKFQWRD